VSALEYTFCCAGSTHVGPVTISHQIDWQGVEEDGVALVRDGATTHALAQGWHIDPDGPYPQVACSEVCFQATHAEWERRRPQREAARASLLQALDAAARARVPRRRVRIA
jgi:hypothetical protein